MARKRRTPAQARPLPLSKGEIWEVGRRTLEVSIADLAGKNERPEVVLVVQAGEAGGVVLGDVTTSSAPPAVLVDVVVRAMREPLLGKPRRPEVIRVSSAAEAELLATASAITGIALEVAEPLDALARLQAHMELQLSGMSSDYRTQATRAGETLSPEGLQAFFRTARQFYREAMWETYGDEVLFKLTLQTAPGAGKTLYGIIIGELGQEFGLALYPSLDVLQEFYNASLAHLEEFPHLAQPGPSRRSETEQWQREAEAMADLLQVSTLCLTYTPQRDVPPALVGEAKQGKLPMANKSAFPLVMRTGQGGMRVATALELADMYVAMVAIMDWDKRIDEVESDEEVDITLTLQVPAIPGFMPELTVQTTLQDNPCLPEEDDEDDEDDGDDGEEWMPDLSALFEAFLQEPPRSKPTSQRHTGRQTASRQQLPAAGRPTPISLGQANMVYSLDVSLTAGPVSPAYANRKISRRIDILGRQTLHDLHQAIFEAFERWEHHLYEFNLGEGPGDRSQLYFYTGGGDGSDEETAGDPTTTALATLNLEVGRLFGYTFDMGDQWEHLIEVVAAAEARGTGHYPRITKKVGKAPPQYPDDDADI